MLNNTIQNLYENLNTLCNETKDNEVLLSILKPYLQQAMEFEEEGRLLKIKFKPFAFIIVKVDGLDLHEKQYNLIKEWLNEE